MRSNHRPITLIILDGWGHSDKTEDNAIAAAITPTWDTLWQDCPHTLVSGAGEAVGLPAGQMGNSEVGHLNMGAGRIVYQDYTRVTKSIDDGDFYNNPVLLAGIQEAIQNNKKIHIFGLLSPGGVHSHEKHIHAFLECCHKQNAKQVVMHAFLDGRDTPPRSALSSLETLDKKFKEYQFGGIASIVGRYYAMDRDKRWERTQLAYELVCHGQAEFTAISAAEALEQAYKRDESDEFVKPTHITCDFPSNIEDGDVIVFMNFRADRARQLTHALTDQHFDGFERTRFPKLGQFISLTSYSDHLRTNIAFAPKKQSNVFAEVIAKHDLAQLHIAETEKYAHVTFFFNGGREEPFPGEDRILVPSPKVATYDLKPEMSANELTDELVGAISSEKYDAIICNFANADMVGHSGNFDATVLAIETIDNCLKCIINTLEKVGGECVITADHGNAECMRDPSTEQAHTAHTTQPVPFVYVGRPAKISNEQPILSDLAPTLLHLMGIEKPVEMTGCSIIEVSDE